MALLPVPEPQKLAEAFEEFDPCRASRRAESSASRTGLFKRIPHQHHFHAGKHDHDLERQQASGNRHQAR